MKQECKEFKAFYDGIGKVGKWSCNYHDYTFHVIIKKNGWLRKKMHLEVWRTEPELEPGEAPPAPYNTYEVSYYSGAVQQVIADSYKEDGGVIRFAYRDETVTQMRWEDVRVISLRRKCLNAST